METLQQLWPARPQISSLANQMEASEFPDKMLILQKHNYCNVGILQRGNFATTQNLMISGSVAKSSCCKISKKKVVS